MKKSELRNHAQVERTINPVTGKIDPTQIRSKSAKRVEHMSLGQTTIHEIRSDAWCSYCYEYVEEGQMDAHVDKLCRPTLPRLDLIKASGAMIDEMPYLDE